MDLNVYIEGTGSPILCLHGHPGSGRSLSVFTANLSERFQTIAPDLRGYGNSRVRTDFSMSDHLSDLEALLDRLKIERCLLLGWSLGGILALELALKFPQRFSGLILVATAARPRSNHPPVTWQDLFNTAVAGIINYVSPGWNSNIEIFGKRSLFRYLLAQHTPSAYHYLAKEGVSAYLQTSTHARRALLKALEAGYNRLDDLARIEMPSLVLAGDSDLHITPNSSLETARMLKHSQWVCYPNTAHLFPWEIPDRVLADINTWLAAQIPV